MMADNVELLRDPDAYEDARFAALAEAYHQKEQGCR